MIDFYFQEMLFTQLVSHGINILQGQMVLFRGNTWMKIISSPKKLVEKAEFFILNPLLLTFDRFSGRLSVRKLFLCDPNAQSGPPAKIKINLICCCGDKSKI